MLVKHYLREFISHQKRRQKPRNCLLTNKLKDKKYNLSVEVIEDTLRLISENNKDMSKAFLKVFENNKIDLNTDPLLRCLLENKIPSFSYHDEQVDLIKDFLQGKFSTKKLQVKRSPVEDLLQRQLGLKYEE